ncbi:MAG: hypothetical protein JNM02_06250 [Anaerolineales bacterium]|nr:hypothetical protein [Anaerolineales bacterium]
MDTLKKPLAILCSIFFVVTAVIALFLFNFDRRAFTAETYQKAFARNDFYNQIPGLMADAMTSSNADQSQFPVVMRGMGREAWEAFFRSLLPPDVLKAMGDEVLNSTFAYLNMKTDSAQLNLAPLKASLTSDTGAQAVLSLLGTLPDCTFAQIAQMTINLLSGGQIEFCNPPAELYPALTPIIQGQLQFTAAAIPDQVTIISAPSQNDPRQRLLDIRFFMRLSPMLPLAFLLGLTLFAVRSLKSWLTWWGIPFFITGSLAFVMSLIGAPVFGAVFQRILVNRMAIYLPPILLNYGSDLAAAMVQALFTPILWQGLLIAVLGLGMAVTGYFVKENTYLTS